MDQTDFELLGLKRMLVNAYSEGLREFTFPMLNLTFPTIFKNKELFKFLDTNGITYTGSIVVGVVVGGMDVYFYTIFLDPAVMEKLK